MDVEAHVENEDQFWEGWFLVMFTRHVLTDLNPRTR